MIDEHRRLLELAADPARDLGLVVREQVDRAREECLTLSGRVLPVMTSIMVVLPAPFGPITQRSSPRSM